MAIFRGTTGTGSSDNTIVSAVTEQAGIATTKASEASASATTASTSASSANFSAVTAATKASEASVDAANADLQRQACVGLKLETLDVAQEALASANAAEASANTANSSAVQTVAGSNTQVVGVYNNIANVNTVAGVNTDVTTVAGISSDVTTVAADASDIGTVSTNIANVNNVGNNIANVNAVHGNASNINTVAADGTDIGTVATNIANVNTVAGISSNVTTVAGLESKMDTVIADASDIGAVAGNIGDVTTVAGINSDVDTVAGIAAKVTTVADNISDVQNADTNATNAASSASDASASATSASNSATTATNKATEASNSATAASNSATTATTKASQAAGSATTAGTSASTATTKASEASASATTATTKAGEAASSASAASGSASTAVTKASEASVSAASAATSATNSSNAASTWNNFYNSYLGVADAPPSVDVLGNAIVAGALYYDTGAGSNTVGLYVYNGSSWVYSTNYNNVTAPYSLSQDLATNSHDISFGDNAKANFGASDDLQIYHDGSNSYVTDIGTGGLYLRGSNEIALRSSSNENIFLGLTDGSAYVYHNGSVKLQTTSTGVDVTGTATMDGLTVDNSIAPIVTLTETGVGTYYTVVDGGHYSIRHNDLTTNYFRLQSNGDISFYEDTGTTPKFFWDASTERLGIGTSSPDALLTIDKDVSTAYSATDDSAQRSNTNTLLLKNEDGTANSFAQIAFDLAGSNQSIARIVGLNDGTSTSALAFVTEGSNTKREVMRLEGNGNVGIGTTSPTALLDVVGASGSISNITVSNPDVGLRMSAYTDQHAEIRVETNHPLLFKTNGNNERMRIDASGNVGIGVTGPTGKVQIYKGGQSSYQTYTTTNSGLILQSYQSQGNPYTKTSDIVAGSDGTVPSEIRLLTRTAGQSSVDERMRIDSSGRVGIGTSSPSAMLDVELGATGTIAEFRGGDSDILQIKNENDLIVFDTRNTANGLAFQMQGAERMRIDSSGNVLVGKTSQAYATAGLELEGAGRVVATRDGASAGIFARLNSDGDIVNFRKDGTTVGSIGVVSGSNFYINNGDTGLGFRPSADDIVPVSSGGSGRDNAIDIGDPSFRFKDLYLSKRVYSGNPTNTAGNLFLHIDGDADGVSTGYKIRSGVGVSTGSSHIAFVNPNGIVGQIRTDGSSTSYNTSSDERLKENIQDADDAGSKIDAIQVRQFDWRIDGTHESYGVVAQELAQVAPEAVSGNPESEEMMGVDYSKLVPTLIKEIQTLRNRVAQLENN